jgi:hypothetical protein
MVFVAVIVLSSRRKAAVGELNFFLSAGFLLHWRAQYVALGRGHTRHVGIYIDAAIGLSSSYPNIALSLQLTACLHLPRSNRNPPLPHPLLPHPSLSTPHNRLLSPARHKSPSHPHIYPRRASHSVVLGAVG